MFNRKIIEELKVWKEKADRKPLMMLGARQVGKTSSVFSIKAPFTVSSRLSMDKKIGEGIFDFLFCFIKPYQML